MAKYAMGILRTIGILTIVLELGFLLGVFTNHAEAACTCVCVEGKAKAQCPSVLETATCPASVCSADTRVAPPMPRTDCQLVQVIDPATGKVKRKRVCK